jgi:vancomycin resistance protein YoaR
MAERIDDMAERGRQLVTFAGPAPTRRVARASLAMLAVLACCTGAGLLVQQLDDRPVPGVRLAGMDVPRSGSLDEFLQRRARAWGGESVTLETGFHLWRLTRHELGAELPVHEARRDLAQLGRSWNPLVALRASWQGRFGRGHDLRWRPRIVDQRALEHTLQRIRREVDRLPTPASSSPEGARIAGLPGEVLDIEATRRAVESGIRAGARWIKVATVVTPPSPTLRRFVQPRDEAAVLMMRQDTSYRASNRGRATNIELGARKLDGVVLMPGEAFSFNRVVGKRTLEAGFAPAHELINGEVVLGVGGGVCQVAGTLHAAAFFAGLTIDEYRAHSRLSQLSYLRPGLDTMVAWPDHVHDVRDSKDMRLRNPYPFPVRIRAALLPSASGLSTLRIELYGAARPFRVDFSFEEIARVPAGELRRVDATLATGVQRVKQESLHGMEILRRRTIYTPTGRVEEAVRVSYPPTPRVVLVGAR